MGFSKNFRVRNGLEVSDGLFVADGDLQKVGIGTTNPLTDLDVRGTTTSNNVIVSNQLQLDGTISIANSVGSANQYLISTGTGVTWTSLPGLRETFTFTAIEGESVFNVDYNPDVGVDLYVNGVKLSPNEYIATNGTSITLVDSAYTGDTIDVIAYSVAALAVNSNSINVSGVVSATDGFLSTGSTGVTIKVEGTQLIFEAVGIGSTSFTLS